MKLPIPSRSDLRRPRLPALSLQKLIAIVLLLFAAYQSFALWAENKHLSVQPSTIKQSNERNTKNPIVQEREQLFGNQTQVQGREHDYTGDNLVWVVGNGRTGTNFLGDILLSHSQIGGKNERKPEFNLVTHLAVHQPVLPQSERDSELEQIIQQYRIRSKETYDSSTLRYHSDKSHPALFLAQELHAAFPQARMIGSNRCVYPTVASCMLHEGVSAWFQKADLFRKPNKFLGLTKENAQVYKRYPLHVQCAMRWASHQLEYERVLPLLNTETETNLVVFEYRQWLLNPEQELKRLQAFLNLELPFSKPPQGHVFNATSWQSKITAQQKATIDKEFHRLGYDRLITTYCHESELAV